ncbi:MAG: ferrochelatase [Planctomycetes bacterium]|nr:ferrochelatase [Planctomycetota bacterium]NOG54145.1 ferrochelatase [Planctomycetota bacterium]
MTHDAMNHGDLPSSSSDDDGHSVSPTEHADEPRPADARHGVILLSYGTPDRLEDIPPYLTDIRGGRETSQELVDEITERYRRIGGRSPLADITKSCARKLSAQLGLPVYVGMRHWTPYIKDVVTQIARETGIERLAAICMAPHYSELSIGAYRTKLAEAIEQASRPIEMRFVPEWYTQTDFISGLALNLSVALKRIGTGSGPERAFVVFSAHSLPRFILERGDPYPDQLLKTAKLVAEKLSLDQEQWTFCFQSAGQTAMPWLGPSVEEVVPKLAQEGHRRIVLAPIGFVADHVEVLYDLDIEVPALLTEFEGLEIERTPMLNDSPSMIAALAALATEALG